MTQEEKARAYDEALKRARALRQEAIDKEYAIDYVKDYEAIFPELAESEDERIRKELIEAFEVYDIESSWNLIPVKHILAWLEKQKEPRHAIRATKGFGDPDGPQFELVDLQDEPKQEWSEEDEKMLENIRYALRYAYFNSVIDEQTTEYAMDWLKSLRPSWKPSDQ